MITTSLSSHTAPTYHVSQSAHKSPLAQKMSKASWAYDCSICFGFVLFLSSQMGSRGAWAAHRTPCVAEDDFELLTFIPQHVRCRDRRRALFLIHMIQRPLTKTMDREASCDTSLPNRALCEINAIVPKASGNTPGTHQRCFSGYRTMGHHCNQYQI